MSDYFHECQQARQLGEMRTQREEQRCRDQGITPEDKKAASDQIGQLYGDFDVQPPGERLRRYERHFELARIRGYFYSVDPAFDLIRIGAVRREMARLGRRLREEN